MTNKAKKSEYAQREEKILAKWQRDKTFEASLKKKSPKGDYTFLDGPPFATGLPHYGSLLSSEIKDAIARYQTMRGFHVHRRWGWDCHGLPIENMVEAELKIPDKKAIEDKLGIAKFNEACRKSVLGYAKDWKVFVDRIGRWTEFDNAYKTMDSTYMESVWWALKQMWDKDLIYHGRRVLLYCPRCETPISNAEVAMDNSYKQVTDTSVTVKFKVKNHEARIMKHGVPTYLVAWTTTPWSLFTVFGLSVGKKFDYSLIEYNGEQLIIAKDRVEAVMEGLDRFKVVKNIKGKDLIGLEFEHLVNYFYRHPEVKGNKKVYKVYDADYVTVEEGTGIVTINGSYGEDDFNQAQAQGLPVVMDIDEQGNFKDDVKDFAGKYALNQNDNIAKFLDDKGLLLRQDKYKHPYPHCHRCETKLQYRALPSWFINIQKVKPELLKLNEKINWYPGHLKHGRFKKIVEGAPDWNISRNRYWASPLPFWKCESCTEHVCIGSLAELKKLSTNYNQVYKSDDINKVDLHRPFVDKVKLKCSKCKSEMSRVPEVVDGWVESGSAPFAEHHYPFENKKIAESRMPADFIAEYIAQTRTWFYYLHVISTILFKKPAFSNVITTGTILAANGDKLSKSKRNFTEPTALLDEYGADPLRLYMLDSPVMDARDLFFDDRGVSEAYRKVVQISRNVVTFYESYGSKLTTKDLKPSTKHVLDKYIVSLLNQTATEVTEAWESYDTIKVGKSIRSFITELSTWYLRRSRDRFKAGDEDGIKTFGYVLLEMSKLLAPIAPYLAEDIYERVKGPEKSVHLDNWPVANKKLIDSKLLDQMELVHDIVERGLAARAEAGVKIRQPLTSYATDLVKKLDKDLIELVNDELNIKSLKFGKVKLDVKLTGELKLEGLYRELVRTINGLRKKQGLTVADRIVLNYETSSKDIVKVFDTWSKEMQEAILADELLAGMVDDEVEVVEVNGEKIKIKLIKK
ncbi:isoleucine--tRNA ligase [bacterium]|nr:isoleucine--tRNA ligase [bacterium]